MKNASHYVLALDYQKKVLDLLESFVEFFNKEETKGYLFAENRKDNSIDLVVGSERFTVLSNIQERGKIIFDVFGWEFDLASLTRYTSKKIDELTLVKDGASLMFKNTVYDYDNRDFVHLVNLDQQYGAENIERFFDQLEIYINKKNNPRPLRVY